VVERSIGRQQRAARRPPPQWDFRRISRRAAR
jgi:hypothetical protein